MPIGADGQNLVFLVSQPRAGSTLLQRMLGAHPEVHTLSEPWLMLHDFYALRPGGLRSEYDAGAARRGLESFLTALPGGADDYLAGVRRMHVWLYDRALEPTGKRCFLDKTPRYYLVLPELERVFPAARYVLLFRNPLAVLVSILRTWVGDDWVRLADYRHDLLQAPELLVAAAARLGERVSVIRYERLVQEPEAELRRLCGELGLAYVPAMVEYGRSDQPRWRYGDKQVLLANPRPVASRIDPWLEALEDRQVWRLARDYLEALGPRVVEAMGYSYAELRALIEARRPPTGRRFAPTHGLAWHVGRPEARARRRAIARLTQSLRRRGVSGTAWHAVRRLPAALRAWARGAAAARRGAGDSAGP